VLLPPAPAGVLLEPAAPPLVFVAPPVPGVAPAPPCEELPAVAPLPDTPPIGLLPPFSDELQATEKHTAQAPNSETLCLVMNRIRMNERRAVAARDQ